MCINCCPFREILDVAFNATWTKLFYICIHTYIYTHTHTHIYTYIYMYILLSLLGDPGRCLQRDGHQAGDRLGRRHRARLQYDDGCLPGDPHRTRGRDLKGDFCPLVLVYLYVCMYICVCIVSTTR